MQGSHTISRFITLTVMAIATASFFAMAMTPAASLFAG